MAKMGGLYRKQELGVGGKGSEALGLEGKRSPWGVGENRGATGTE